MAESIELKIGQVWVTHGIAEAEIIALGPAHVVVKDKRHGGLSVCYIPSFRSAAVRLLRPKHELWVNVYRNQIGDTWAGANMISRGKADEDSCRRGTQVDRIACLKIEFEEGEGL